MDKGFSWSGLFLLLFFSVLFRTAGGAAETSAQVVRGSDGWLFLQQELRFLDVGPFWGKQAQAAGRAKRLDARDPTPAIVAFNRALADKGITLLLVPVPPKALIYSEHVGEAKRGEEWGKNLDRYYKILADKGVRVLDLRPTFSSLKKSQEKPLYCRKDTHWSGYGLTVAADRIAGEIEKIAQLTTPGSPAYTGKWRTLQIVGDLQRMLGDTSGKETVAVREIIDDGGRHPQADLLSPVLVLGDSHVLVFHDGGDMYATGAGVSDQLAYALSRPVDVLGVRGSGATPARLSLYRRAQRTNGYWGGKKVVVWCFSAREFTESDGWRVLPIEPEG